MDIDRRQFLGATATVGVAALLSACGVPQRGGSSGSGTLKALYMQQAGYPAPTVNAMTKAFEQANPDIKVENTFVAYEALHDKIVISASAGTFDVVHIDCIWPAELASKKMIVDVTGKVTDKYRKGILPGSFESVKYQDKLYGLPWGPSTKLFFFNEQLLDKAGISGAKLTTWDDVAAAAKTLRDKKVLKHPLVWSWSQAEAIMCDFAQLLGSFGGTFLDGDGNPAFHQGGGLQALTWMKKSLDDGISDPSSLKSLEDDVKKVLLQNRAAMAINWEYVYPASQSKKETETPGAISVIQTPKGPGGKALGVNGGMGLAVATGSKNADQAWQLIQWLAGEKQTTLHAKDNLPAWRSAYTKKDVVAGQEDLVKAEEKQQEALISRPNVANYNAISQRIQEALQDALLGRKTPKKALTEAAEHARDLINS